VTWWKKRHLKRAIDMYQPMRPDEKTNDTKFNRIYNGFIDLTLTIVTKIFYLIKKILNLALGLIPGFQNGGIADDIEEEEGLMDEKVEAIPED